MVAERGGRKKGIQGQAKVGSPGSVNHGEIFAFSCLKQVNGTQLFHYDSRILGTIVDSIKSAIFLWLIQRS